MLKISINEKDTNKQPILNNPVGITDANNDKDELFPPNHRSAKNGQANSRKKIFIFLITGLVSMLGGVVLIVLGFLKNIDKNELVFPGISHDSSGTPTIYSSLTGEPLADESLKTAPAYCIQIPNGTDGARPQSGVTDAGVVFEAIAEAGITRFAAIFQNPTPAVIGPIRSLRIYFLEWDTPFDCTIVHAGGASDALDAVAAGGYRDLSEDYTYMYRGTYSNRLWNNLFTTSSYLKQYSRDHNYDSSDIKGFKRMTPEESAKDRVDKGVKTKLDILKATSENTSEIIPSVSLINLNLGGWDNFNVKYEYNPVTNTYNRSYGSGLAHEVYQCPDEDLGEKNPEDACELTQVSPSVVIAMMVQEGKAADGYHEAITAVGSGKAYIFQNGTVIEGTWSKAALDKQIEFTDSSGAEVSLAPGQTFITAVPNYGSIEY